MRTFLADAAHADKILTAARKYRGQIGTLTGEAAGGRARARVAGHLSRSGFLIRKAVTSLDDVRPASA
ncbi:hypothetical protein [Kribbella sp. VKM Ac-2568]|uniref:hypothetical protein n=1 Tax=Kribbella sp. VKM Ac-2568 TaxID=2512219 RepID=UPI0013053B03|nr:hypothetical protein [Kribbella sp. VKM Ac-2568]